MKAVGVSAGRARIEFAFRLYFPYCSLGSHFHMQAFLLCYFPTGHSQPSPQRLFIILEFFEISGYPDKAGRVDYLVVIVDFVVDMGAGAPAGAAYQADDLAP